jgi:type I site-specific restriction endonuclease
LTVLLDIAIFLGDNNDLEEAEDDDDQIDEQEEIDHDLMMEENKEDVTERVTSQLRQSNNGNPAVI